MTKKQTMMDKIIKMSKQLYHVGKISPDMRKCVIVAVEQIIGNQQLSQHCMMLGITKKDYINYIMEKMKDYV